MIQQDESAFRRLLAQSDGRRRIVALAGPPGAGKSTVAEGLKADFGGEILPLDGFHYDDAVLTARGHFGRKGAPHTFDLDGFRTALERLRADGGRDVAVPVFDRALEIARAGARVIAGSQRLILAEGNYLLLDQPGWRDLAALFDATAMVTAPEDVLANRLRRRWQGLGYSREQVDAKLECNDLPNLRLVLTASRPADYRLRCEDSVLACRTK